jgi:hypothetical protein
MPIRSFIAPGAFDPETIAAISEVLEAACERVGDTNQPEVAREVIAGRIIAAAKLGEHAPLLAGSCASGIGLGISAAVRKRKVARPFKEICRDRFQTQTPASNPP